MDRELAKKLVLFVNTPGNMDSLDLYIQAQLDWNKEQLIYAHDFETVRFHQGRIRELLELSKIRVKVLTGLGKKLDEKGNPTVS